MPRRLPGVSEAHGRKIVGAYMDRRRAEDEAELQRHYRSPQKQKVRIYRRCVRAENLTIEVHIVVVDSLPQGE